MADMDLFKHRPAPVAVGGKLTLTSPEVLREHTQFEQNRQAMSRKIRALEIEDADLEERMAHLTQEVVTLKARHDAINNQLKHINIIMKQNSLRFWNAVSETEPAYDFADKWEVVRTESTEAAVVIMRSPDQDSMIREGLLEMLKGKRNGERQVGFGRRD